MRAGDGAALVKRLRLLWRRDPRRSREHVCFSRRFDAAAEALPQCPYRRSDSDKSCRFASSQSEFASPDSANLRLRSEIK